jgi:hypothetical protein
MQQIYSHLAFHCSLLVGPSSCFSASHGTATEQSDVHRRRHVHVPRAVTYEHRQPTSTSWTTCVSELRKQSWWAYEIDLALPYESASVVGMPDSEHWGDQTIPLGKSDAFVLAELLYELFQLTEPPREPYKSCRLTKDQRLILSGGGAISNYPEQMAEHYRQMVATLCGLLGDDAPRLGIGI